MQPALRGAGLHLPHRCTQPKARGAVPVRASASRTPTLPTVLGYGHGDVIRGLDAGVEGRALALDADRSRTAAGTGAASPTTRASTRVNIAALADVLETRGKLGFNAKYLIEMGEETGSPGLRELCDEQRELFAADVLIASDGPRLARRAADDLPRLARRHQLRPDDRGARGRPPLRQLGRAALQSRRSSSPTRSPASSSPDRPDPHPGMGAGVACPTSVRRALADCEVDGGADGPAIDPGWGEPGLTPAERVFGWCSFEVLAYQDRQSGDAGQRDPAARLGALPAALRGRRRPDRHPAGAAPPPRPPRLSDGADRHDPRRDVPRDAPRSGRSLGAMGGRLDRRPPAARSRRSCPTSAARCRTTSSPTSSACRPSGCRIPIRAARSMRRTSTCRPPSLREGLRDHGRALLGPRRRRYAEAERQHRPARGSVIMSSRYSCFCQLGDLVEATELPCRHPPPAAPGPGIVVPGGADCRVRRRPPGRMGLSGRRATSAATAWSAP